MEICIVGNLGSPAARPLTQFAFDCGLEPPDYTPEQHRLVGTFGLLAEQLAVPVLQVRDGQITQIFNRLKHALVHRFSRLSVAVNYNFHGRSSGAQKASRETQEFADDSGVEFASKGAAGFLQNEPAKKLAGGNKKRPVASFLKGTLPAIENRNQSRFVRGTERA